MKPKTVKSLLRHGGGKMTDWIPVPRRKLWTSKTSNILMDTITIVAVLVACIGMATCI